MYLPQITTLSVYDSRPLFFIVDAPENPVGVPITFPITGDISGGQISLVGNEAKDVAVLQQYNIQFVTSPSGQNEMIIGEEIDRDVSAYIRIMSCGVTYISVG